MLLAVSLLLAFQENTGFEEGLRGWGGGGEGYERTVDESVAREGKKSAKISGSGDFATITQTVEAKPHLGGRVLLRGWIRAEKVEGGASLWMRVDGEKEMLAFDNAQDRPVKATRDWTRLTIVLPVPEGARSIVLGAMLMGKGTAWFDALELHKLDPVDPDPRPLSDRAKKNLETLAKVWGVARFFNPNADDDFDLALIRAIPKVEAAKDDLELATALNEMLGPLGRVYVPIVPQLLPMTVEKKGKFAVLRGGTGPVPKFDAEGAVLDMRGYLPLFGVEGIFASLTAKPLQLPAARSVTHLGYPGGEGSVYRTSHPLVEGRRIEPKGAGMPLVVVTGPDTWPDLAPYLVALREAGVRIVGAPVPAWVGEPHSIRLFDDWHLAVPLTTLSEVEIQPDAPGGIDEAIALLEGKKLPEKKRETPKEDNLFPAPEMRAVRLASVIILWNVLHYFYPYWDVVKVDWWEVFREHLARAATDKTPGDLRRTLARMLAKAEDGHGGVQVPGGDPPPWTPPIRVERIEEKWIVTRSDAKEVARGAELTSVDGRSVKEIVAAIAPELSASTPQWRDFLLSMRLQAGAKDSEAVLTLDGKEVRLKRTTYAWALREERPVSKLVEGFGYISLDGTSAKEIDDAIRKFKESPGIVFDLRGYPGSDFQEIGWLIDSAAGSQHMDIPVVTRPDKKPEWQKGGWSIQPRKPKYAGKVAFLTDGSAISAAETYMAIIKFNKVARIFGEPTAGTNGNITFLRMPGGISVTFTGMRVTNIDGSTHHGVGVPPDHVARRTIAGVREGRDEVFEAAILKLKEK